MVTGRKGLAAVVVVVAATVVSSAVAAIPAHASPISYECRYRTTAPLFVFADADPRSARVGTARSGESFASFRTATLSDYHTRRHPNRYYLPYHGRAGHGWVAAQYAALQHC